MKKLMLSTLCVATLCLSGCVVKTELRGFVDPAFKSSSYKNVLVVTDFSHRVKAPAYRAAARAVPTGVKLSFDDDVFLPTREYTAAERAAVIKKSGYDAVLTLATKEKGEDKFTEAPDVYATEATPVGAATVGLGGGHVSKPYAVIKAELTDAATQKTAWMGDISCAGSADAKWPDIATAALKKSLRALQAEHLISSH